MQTAGVIGAGSFGTALADLLARRGHSVRLWARHPEMAAAINETRRNPTYLSDFVLHEGIQATSDLRAVVEQAAWVVVAVPSHALREVLSQATSAFSEKPLILAAKGIEVDTLMTMDEVAASVLGEAVRPRLCTLSGPSFAREIMLGHPTAVVLGCADESLAGVLAEHFFCDSFRAYTSTDVIGVEMGGALKNVIAIAVGAAAGMGLGDNTRAALITRGLAEITRLAVAKGAHPMTLAGLAGMGDLVLTCTGALSRNRAVGQALGEGKTLSQALASIKQVAEGVRTARSAHLLAEQLHVDARITRGVYQGLYEGVPVQEVLAVLVGRRPGSEF